MGHREWYRFDNAADPGVVDIHVIDFIGDWIDDYFGFGVTAKSFIDQLSKLPDAVHTIRVHVNSPGGDVFSAVNIANALRDQRTAKGRTVETIVEGLAASAASLLIMGGDPVRIADNGLVMIHNPITALWGNARELRRAADELDKIQGASLLGTYRWHAKVSDEEMVQMLDATTWLDADEAVAKGFATEKIEGLKAAATLDPAAVAKLAIPEKFRARVAALVKPAPAPVPTPAAAEPQAVVRACREAGFPELAEDLLALPMEAVTARLTQAKAARTAAETHATAIRALCTTAKVPELAEGYIQAHAGLDVVRAHLVAITARLDAVTIDGALPPEAVGGTRPTALNTSEIYAARNGRPAAAKGAAV